MNIDWPNPDMTDRDGQPLYRKYTVQKIVVSSVAPHRTKWTSYEQAYILPCFGIAKELGYPLDLAVTANPGKNCVMLLIEHLRATHDEYLQEYECAVEVAATQIWMCLQYNHEAALFWGI